MLDLKIVGGQVLDGTGAPATRVDVGVARETITTVGDLSRAAAAMAGRSRRAAGN